MDFENYQGISVGKKKINYNFEYNPDTKQFEKKSSEILDTGLKSL